MTLGKQKCRILKQIRQRIADENDIPYVTRECSFQGECRGTCPRCESELRFLENQLALRASMGKRVAVAALAAGISLGAAGCSPFGRSGGNSEPTDLSGAVAYTEPGQTDEPEIEVETGEVAYPDEPEAQSTTGEAAPPEETEDPTLFITTGMLPYPEETEQPCEIESELTGDVLLPEAEGNG